MRGNSLLDRLDRKIGRYALRNLMTIIVIGTGLVWLLNYFVAMRTGIYLSAYLSFNKAAILQGEVWRVVTFVFIPQTSNPFMLLLSLYFYWLIGNALENYWGSFKFDIFYLCGVIGGIVSGFISGYATNGYLHLSLFLAFAILNPDYQVLLFFFLPVKMKYLAIIDGIGLLLLFIFYPWWVKLMIAMAMLNIALFFWRDCFYKIRQAHRRRKYRREATPQVKKFKPPKEKKGKKNEDDDFPFEL